MKVERTMTVVVTVTMTEEEYRELHQHLTDYIVYLDRDPESSLAYRNRAQSLRIALNHGETA